MNIDANITDKYYQVNPAIYKQHMTFSIFANLSIQFMITTE